MNREKCLKLQKEFLKSNHPPSWLTGKLICKECNDYPCREENDQFTKDFLKMIMQEMDRR